MKIINAIKQKWAHRQWSEEELDKYLGAHMGTYFTYAADPAIRERAASGGSVSALLIHLLEEGRIDGALVCETIIELGRVRAAFKIARERSEVMAAQGSKYAAVDFAADALPLIDDFEGRLAVVALPCDAAWLRKYTEKHPQFDNKIALIITLFCGHNSEPALVDGIIGKWQGKHGTPEAFTFRSGHWRGRLSARFADGTEIDKPFSTFSDYQNLFFFAQRKCHHCFDHFGYNGDISVGDIWSPEMKANPIKHSALIVRSVPTREILHHTMQTDILKGREVKPEAILDGQIRGAPFHYNVSARARVGGLFGMRIKDRVNERVRWNDYLTAFIALLNEKMSRSALGRRFIFGMPRVLIKLYLYIFKGLQSL